MDYFPAFLDLRGRPCLVVGGGDIALRKARLLHAAGADIRVVATKISPAFSDFVAAHGKDSVDRVACP